MQALMAERHLKLVAKLSLGGLLFFQSEALAATLLSLQTNSAMVKATPGKSAIVPVGLGVGVMFSLNDANAVSATYDTLVGKETFLLLQGANIAYTWYLMGGLSTIASHSLLSLESAPINSFTLSTGFSVKSYDLSSIKGVDTRFLDIVDKDKAKGTSAGVSAAFGYEFLITTGVRLGPRFEGVYPIAGAVKLMTVSAQLRTVIEL